MSTNDKTLPNFYSLPFAQQSALRKARHSPISEATNGMTIRTVEELREADLIDADGWATRTGLNVLGSGPHVGMGATEMFANDLYAWTVITALSRTSVIVQRDNAKRTDKNGHSEAQQWGHTPNPEGETREITLRTDGYWRERGRSLRDGAPKFAIGERRTYRNPSV